MNQFVFANNVQTTLAAAITSPTQTTIELSSTDNLPTIPAGFVWALTLNDAATQSFFEIVYVTSISGANLTVLRGQENTTARTWNVSDLAYACATAGVFASFLNSGGANFVQLSPATTQAGFINISGPLTAGQGNFTGVSVGGALTNATTGAFSGDVNALDFIASRAYSNTGLAGMPLRFNGSSTVVGVGPSSGLATQGITASALAIGAVSTGKYIAIDVNGNLAASGSLYGIQGIFSNEVTAPALLQNGLQVLDTVTSSTLSVTKTGHSVEIELSGSGQIPLGGSFVNDGNGSNASISLPNYGQWFIEAFYAVTQSNNANMTLSFYLIGGTMTGGFISNADATSSFNAVKWITLFGKGHTTVNNQTLTFAFVVGGSGSLDPSNQPWTVRATRTA